MLLQLTRSITGYLDRRAYGTSATAFMLLRQSGIVKLR